MLFSGQQLHQSVFSELAVQVECQPDQCGCGGYTESDAEPLADTGHIENDKQHEQSQQPAGENKKVLRLESLELRTLADPLVQFIVHIHYYIGESVL